ncbi:hypothetical protein D8770_26780 [Methylobacterium sp. DB1607]|nr:hypothetical protein [Methylobacterium sp. DB1607]
MGTPGYVYALINPSTPGLVKVGMTSRDPSDRVSELSAATGVATPFILVYKEHFSDCKEAESYVHTVLEHQGLRVSNNREFFHGEISDVIKAISSAPGKCAPGMHIKDEEDDLLTYSYNDDLDDLKLEDYKPKTPDQELYAEAEEYYYGFGDTIQDYDEALKLFRQAAKLGSSEAYHMIGRMYADGDGVREDHSKALEYFKEAARRGAFCAYGRMGIIFNGASHIENENKSWKKFFDALKANPTQTFECESVGILVHSFLFTRTSAPSFLSSAKISLNPSEQSYIGAIKAIKNDVLESSQRSYEISVESNGENHPFSKQRKAIISWVQSL